MSGPDRGDTGPSEPWIGRALRRREDPPLLTGRGLYSSDVGGPEVAHLAIRRAGVPSGRIRVLDLAPALAMPGVLGAWSHGMLGLADDHMPDPPGPQLARRRPLLASGLVRYEGEAVAVVAATTEYAAQDAAAAVDLEVDAGEADDSPVTVQEFGFGHRRCAGGGPRAPPHGARDGCGYGAAGGLGGVGRRPKPAGDAGQRGLGARAARRPGRVPGSAP